MAKKKPERPGRKPGGTPNRRSSGKVEVPMTPALKDRASRAADSLELSLSAFMRLALQEKLSRMDVPPGPAS